LLTHPTLDLLRQLGLNGMAKAGWIEAQVGSADRRERYWQLTKNGKALHKRARPLWHSAQRKLEKLRGASAMQSLRGELANLVSDMS